MSKFFINRPIVAMVISILTVIVGVVDDRKPADSPVPEYRPAGDSAVSDVRRRRCADDSRSPSPPPSSRKSTAWTT